MALELGNLVAAAILTGLIWTIQVVHYPLFARVGTAEWAAYEAEHQTRITRVVLPVMSANVVLSLLLVGHGALGVLNAALACGIFLATGLVYAPMHGKLADDPAGIARLVRLNWLRTLAWTGQLVVAVALVPAH